MASARASDPTAESADLSASPRSRSRSPILIAGGGIGGLATAIALDRAGIPSIVLERQAEFSEAGAGIQLGPNGMRVLAALGVDSVLEPVTGKPERLDIRDGASARLLAQIPLGAAIAARHGAPYRTAHRADLQAALLEVARRASRISIVTGFEVADIEQTGADATAIAVDGRRQHGPGLIAADGLWSRVRARAFGAQPLHFSFRSAARALIPADAVEAMFGTTHVGIWLAPRTHVVHYPVRDGALIAVIVVTEDTWRGAEWAAPAEGQQIAARASRLAPEVRRFLALAPEWRKWSLFDVPPLPTWTWGRVALLGDAAHPVLPFLAQGGVLALEDALAMARCVADAGDNLPAAFVQYETLRRSRAIRVQDGSRENGRLYHLGGVMAAGRNLVLRSSSPERLLARYDWLYGWRPEAPAPTGDPSEART